LTQRSIITFALIGSTSLLITAFIFQFLGYTPCKICIWQRWPHGFAIFVSLLWLIKPKNQLLVIGSLTNVLASALGVYHSGIEKKWWLGPQSCTSAEISNLSTAELLAKIMNAPIIRCDEISWSLLGFSMANWNAFLSLLLALVWLLAIKHQK
tara:strand:+ start:766 stop:1224 length:459 start_codon:yes stop_codon:yes gene_type:complete